MLLRQPYARDPFPPAGWSVPFGRADVCRPGDDLTVVTYGATVERSLEAARVLAEQDGASVEVIDLRTIVPWDQETVAASVRRADRSAFVALLAALYLETRRRGYTVGCGMMAPNVRSLLRHLGARLDVLGPDRDYRGALRAPVRFDVAVHGTGVLERWT